MKLSAPLLVSVCLSLASPWASADIFKCIDAKGNDKYQNFPCPIDSIGSKATTAPPAEQSSKAAPHSTGASAPPVPLPSGKQPEAGMKMNEVRAAWGTPKSTEVIKGIEIWYYEVAPGSTRAVRFDRTGTVLLVTEAEAPHQDNDAEDQEASKP